MREAIAWTGQFLDFTHLCELLGPFSALLNNARDEIRQHQLMGRLSLVQFCSATDQAALLIAHDTALRNSLCPQISFELKLISAD